MTGWPLPASRCSPNAPLRRAFVLLSALYGALLAAGAASAQARRPLIVVLMHGTESAVRPRLDALRGGLRELGYHEGQDYRIEAPAMLPAAERGVRQA